LQRLIDGTKQFFAAGWMYAMPIVAILWIVADFVYAIQLPSGVKWAAFVTATLIGSCRFLIGGLIGFLFGIPRAVASSTPPTSDSQYQANTNLEQVSDWLTKIIVGVGLVQIGRVIPGLTRLAQSMKVPLGGQPSSAAFGLALAIANSLLGFFLFYLWSRSLLKRELE
jgi:Sec-independent protein secretion pathway component TatC